MRSDFYEKTDDFLVHDHTGKEYEIIEETHFIRELESDGNTKTEEAEKRYRLPTGQPVNKVNESIYEITDALEGFFIRTTRN